MHLSLQHRCPRKVFLLGKLVHDTPLMKAPPFPLFPLVCTLLQMCQPMPKLFQDPLYARSTHWNLSTSTVPMPSNTFPAFGPVVLDGYGLCYNVKGDSIYAGISNFKADGSTCAHNLADSLQQSLLDINYILIFSQSKL